MAGVLIGVLIFAGFVLLIVGVISVFSPQPSVGISTRIRAVAVLFAAIAMMVLAAVLAANNPEFTQDLEARKKELQQQAQRRLRDNLKRQEERTQARTSSAEPPSEELVAQPVYDPPQEGPVAPSCADWNTVTFFEAAEVSDVTRCLQAGADLNAQDETRLTPLHRAAGRTEAPAVIEALLNAGADLNARALFDNTPLHFAADTNEAPAVIEALLNAGANPNARNGFNDTPLHRAALTTETPAVIEALLNAGADPNVWNNFANTPLHNAAGTTENPAVIEALLNSDADLNARNGDGATPRDLALKGSDVYWHLAGAGSGGGIGGGVFRIGGGVSAPRLTYKVEPEYSEEARKAKYQGTVVLAIQVWEDGRAHNIRVIRSLDLGLDEKAIQAVQEWKFVPGKKDGVPVKVRANVEVNFRLLEAGADPAAQDEDGFTPLHGAKAAAAVATLPTPAKSERGPKKPAAPGADLEARDRRGETLLHRAVIEGRAEAVTALLEAGADPNARNVICMTPLHYAAGLWRSEAGAALLKAGADPAARDEDGNLPFDKIPAGVGDVLRIQAAGGVFPGQGNIGGPLQTDFYWKLNQAKLKQSTYRLRSPNPIPPACTERGKP